MNLDLVKSYVEFKVEGEKKCFYNSFHTEKGNFFDHKTEKELTALVMLNKFPSIFIPPDLKNSIDMDKVPEFEENVYKNIAKDGSFFTGIFENTRVTVVWGDVLRLKNIFSKVKYKLEAYCVVNSTNSKMEPGCGASGNIYGVGESDNKKKKENQKKLSELNKAEGIHRKIETGWAVSGPVTESHINLGIEEIVHAVAPNMKRPGVKKTKNVDDMKVKMYEVYFRSLLVAKSSKVAFVSMGTGIFGCDIHKTSTVALKAIKDMIKSKIREKEEIILACIGIEDFWCYIHACLHVIDNVTKWSTNVQEIKNINHKVLKLVANFDELKND
ncbi:MAG: macro domain-containing protein [Candidatus Paraimprobicoccus trichonymphae]|uniref:Macro domain-containing protein n=1 Tax=Candidatus Paraimprobicoccus trichonymphae TaxID=3033793 RepID=A0AA48I064_9FIRM|nr:MAG: macro domain-containing protein [Candidatus Paraimprobicoccus trichonymphae]